MRQAQPQERAADRGIAMGRPLALEIGKKRHARRAGGHPRGFLGETLVLARSLALASDACQVIAIPGERPARRKHHAHQVPHPGGDMAKRVDAQARVDARLHRRRQDGPRGSPADDGVA